MNRFSGEGIYTCHVSNIRGGGVKIKRKSVNAVVLVFFTARCTRIFFIRFHFAKVEHSVPYVVAAYPYYEPREQVFRKKWPIYSSLYGTFRSGRYVPISF